jgi:hypothetical protein
MDMTQWKIETEAGQAWVTAYGIAANPTNEAAAQGIHAPNLLLIVDEAGGIPHNIGRNLRGLLTGSNSRMLAIGNPPTDQEDTWFERLCNQDNVTVVTIPASSTPNLSGEVVADCRSCPTGVPPHPLSDHLVDVAWVQETLAEYGADSAFAQSKVDARFPRGVGSKMIPSMWADFAAEAEEPDEDEDTVRLCDLGLEGEDRQWLVRRGAWVRLGVDVAAAGGDELAIARIVGDLVTVEHTSSGAENSHAPDVAGKVLREVQRACALAEALGTAAPVEVKVDANGLGWGVCGLLTDWGPGGKGERLHDAVIVPVIVSEEPGREPPPGSLMRPWRKRDEMWIGGRQLFQPTPDGDSLLRLRTDRRTRAQLSSPTYGTNAQGCVVVEAKDSMKKKGLTSPDRGEAVLLAAYQPVPSRRKKRPKARLVA